ncbi:hypothetical protein EYF80_053387 [Liparis tanakae]|uniref:Uncharacterized protein n=1 Tax=Liparis tanakae TaxID=230148 RepID=A0A4Z2F5Q2_9TELE|nr:hypothetical protein EYF80_053387 [Liparis tanakae]
MLLDLQVLNAEKEPVLLSASDVHPKKPGIRKSEEWARPWIRGALARRRAAAHLAQQLVLVVAEQAERQAAVDAADGAVGAEQQESAQRSKRPHGAGELQSSAGGEDGHHSSVHHGEIFFQSFFQDLTGFPHDREQLSSNQLVSGALQQLAGRFVSGHDLRDEDEEDRRRGAQRPLLGGGLRALGCDWFRAKSSCRSALRSALRSGATQIVTP